MPKTQSIIEKALQHPDIFGAGAKKRKSVPCNLKFGIVMDEFYRGTLFSGSGQKVINPKQAKAIGISETKKCFKKAKRI